MKKLSTRGLMLVSTLAIALAFAAAPSTAGAASTRAEYIAQVDPICQSYVGPITNAFNAYHRAFKSMNRKAKSGTFKAFLRSIRRTANTLSAVAQLHLSMTAQISGVPPVAADAATINAWLTALGQEQSNEVAAVTALRQLRFGPFLKRLNQADAAVNAATTAISGFGFAVCGVAVS
jgi:hypothetical protein